MILHIARCYCCSVKTLKELKEEEEYIINITFMVKTLGIVFIGIITIPTAAVMTTIATHSY